MASSPSTPPTTPPAIAPVSANQYVHSFRKGSGNSLEPPLLLPDPAPPELTAVAEDRVKLDPPLVIVS
jgi:hypothetical protein